MGSIEADIIITSVKMSHTILLVQPGTKPETRTYSDYESVNECMEGVCKIYEEHLKRQNPSIPSITYDISQLFDFIDQLSGGKNNLIANDKNSLSYCRNLYFALELIILLGSTS